MLILRFAFFYFNMCGIVAYVGENPLEIVFDGLQRLEYRGYDSAGFFK